jgi:hypothetical protein
MNTKPLYVIISDGGDGSYYPHYTLNSDLILKLQQAYDKNLMNYDDIGCDGDGFHYSTINVPEECTIESLGIIVIPDNYTDQFFKDE